MNIIQSVKRRISNSEAKKSVGPADAGTSNQQVSSTSTENSVSPGDSPVLSVTSGGLVAGSAERVKCATEMAVDEASFSKLPSFVNCDPSERTELFRRKLQVCAMTFDFNVNCMDKEKELKRQTLLEIVEYVNGARNCFNEEIMQDVVMMVSSNVFRTLPPANGRNPNTIYDTEDDEPILDASWPHLQIVYELFLRFVVSNDVDPKIAKRFIDQTFVLRLLDLFDSEDPRERDYLKTILHRIYGKFMALRSFIRKAIQHLFFKIIYECEYHNGIAELLEILGSIINGFALPLKDEHKHFLEKSLISLHKVKTLNSFHQQLSYCMTQYVEKDPRLALPILKGLLRFWPVTNTPKEVLFLNEVEEILELTQGPEFQRIQPLLFNRIALCIQSPHFQVAERVLFLWNNDYIVKLINQNRMVLFPIVVGALYKNSKSHWNSTVHGLTYNVLKLLMEADPPLFDECTAKHKNKPEKEVSDDSNTRQKHWKALQDFYEAKVKAIEV